MNWYVINCLTGREQEVKNHIQDAGIKAIVPRRVMTEQRCGAWRNVERVVFPSYVFVRAEMTPTDYYTIRYVPGVIRILDNNRPKPLQEEEVTLILKLTMDGDPLGISEVFVEGGRVTVSDGPLKGLEGNIIKLDARRFRAKVNITILGEPRIVDLAVKFIQKT